jgi:hypothetical protein
MTRRFTTVLISEQSTDNSLTEIDTERLHDQLIDSVQSDDHGIEVLAIKTIVEEWEPKSNIWMVVEG